MKNILAIISVALLTSSGGLAVTIQELAGIYRGKFTSTEHDIVERLDHITTIDTNGVVLVHLYLKERGRSQAIAVRIFYLTQGPECDGSFLTGDPESPEAIVRLRGNHLTMVFPFESEDRLYTLQGRRIERVPGSIQGL